MKPPFRSLLTLLSLLVLNQVSDRRALHAAETDVRQVSATGIRHGILLCGNTTVLINEQNEVVWEVAKPSRDGYVLANGNILFSASNVATEMNRSGQTVWTYALDPVNKELGTAVRLENGHTLVVERGPKPRLLEVTRHGQIAAEIPLQPETDNDHMQTRMARKLPNGHYLVPHLLAFKVKEYDPAGKVVAEIRTDLPELGGREAENWPFTAIRMENGHTLVNLTHGNKTAIFDAAGKVVWKVDNGDLEGRFADPCGGQLLPNGHVVITSYAQRDPSKVRVFEVNPQKEVVWELFHPKAYAHGIHVVSTQGRPLEHPFMK
ncbi:MAG TPA: hypothetical protein DEP78_08490 [Verrucomicrobiales bacterium]|nr:hypothetical protein [Verrucomicrobiales bacterium]